MKKKISNVEYEVKLYARYVDDGTVVIEQKSRDKVINDSIIMGTIKDIANEIHSSIQVEVDFPSKNYNNRLAVLDTELWIEEVEIGNETKHQILHAHYQKPMANKYTILKTSAMSYSTKMNILSNEVVRIMRNTSKLCKKEEWQNKIQQFIYRLQYSGYNKGEREQIYKKGKAIFQRIVKNDEDGRIPLYRSKFWRSVERNEEKRKKRTQWFTKKGHKATFFVDATENEILMKECQKCLDNCGLPIKVIEKRGRTLKETLVKSNPFPKQSCSDEECTICCENNNIICKTRDAGQRIYLK